MCLRLFVEFMVCTGDADCPSNSSCTAGDGCVCDEENFIMMDGECSGKAAVDQVCVMLSYGVIFFLF